MTDIEQALQYIDCSTLSYTEWIQVGMAIKEAGMGCDVWDRWSAQDIGRYHTGDCEQHWKSFNGAAQPITQAYIFKLAKDNGWRTFDGNDETLEWDGIIEFDGNTAEQPNAKWNPVEDFKRYLRALFQPDEFISWVTEAKQDEDGKWKPAGKGCYWKTCGDALKQLEKHPEDISDTIGDYSHEAGAWIRFNPVNGEGVNNSNVTAYRFALVESDTMALDAQYRMYRKLNLPIAAMVTSGGKSIHAIVHIDAVNAAEYKDRVELLYTILENHGMVVDTQNKNPSRLSRLPGCKRAASSSIYSRSPPTGTPLAIRLTLIPVGLISLLRYMAVVSPSRLEFVAMMTSFTGSLESLCISSFRRMSSGPIPSIGEIAPCRTW